MNYKKLGLTDMSVSTLGFGSSCFNNFFKDSNFDFSAESLENVRQIINKAFELGINYFDTAPWYNNAQKLLAVGLKGHERSSYYLATKVGRYNSDKEPQHWFDFSYARTVASVEESLKIFDCDYIDLIQVHDFEFATDLDIIVNETLPALDDLKKQGKLKYIGINSYSIEKLKELLEKSKTKIDTVLTFTHLTLDNTSLLDHIEYFRSKKVGIIHSAPLAMGLYSPVGPPNWNRTPDNVKAAVASAFDYCKSKGVHLTKLAIHFSAKNPSVDLNIVSMTSVDIVRDNVSYLSDLNENETNTLKEIRDTIFIPLEYKGYGNEEVLSYMKKTSNTN